MKGRFASLPILTAIGVLALAGCANQPPVPVIDRTAGTSSSAPVPENRPGYYTVKKGDTLYGIALDHGQSYRDIAAWNNLDNPNLIQVGQQLRVAPPGEEGAPVAVAKPIKNTDVIESKPVQNTAAPTAASSNTATFKREPKAGKQAYSDQAWAAGQKTDSIAAAKPTDGAPSDKAAVAEKPADKPIEKSAVKPSDAAAAAADEPTDWAWPTNGKVEIPFTEGSKGVDIPAKAGQPVVAASAGTVTLVSNALRGYGNLVVIKHSPSLLSVYAHNSKVLVKEGQTVAKGQKIAEVGTTDTDAPRLHFEIRRQGKPVDPLKFLPAR